MTNWKYKGEIPSERWKLECDDDDDDADKIGVDGCYTQKSQDKFIPNIFIKKKVLTERANYYFITANKSIAEVELHVCLPAQKPAPLVDFFPQSCTFQSVFLPYFVKERKPEDW